MYAAINHELLNRNNSYVFKNIEKGTSTLRKYLNLDAIEGDTYFYPNCDDECLDDANNTKVGSNYIFNDGRCFKSVIPCSKYDCLDKINLHAWPGIYDDPRAFKSCDKEFDTRQIGTYARFIRIARGNSLKPVTISLIEAYDIFGNYIQPIAGRAEPEVEPHYGSNLMDPDVSNYALTENTENAFIQIDLGSDYNIFMIIIVNAPFAPNNIYGNNVILINSHGRLVFKNEIKHVSDLYVIETKKNEKQAMTVKQPMTVEQPKYEYPECIPNGCLDKKNYTIEGYEYLLSGNRCLKNIVPCYQCLDYDIPIKYFKSCKPDIDTRIASLNIKNIMLDIFNNDTDLVSLEIFYYDRFITPTSITIGPIDPNNCIYKLSQREGCILDKGYFIQAMLPDNSLITDVHISTKTSTKVTMYGSKLYTMDDKNIVQHNEIITYKTPYIENNDITTFMLKLYGTGNDVGNVKLPFTKVDYPGCIPNGCLTLSGAQIPGYYYQFPNGNCAKAISDCVGCLDDVMNRYKVDNNTASCSDLYETRLPPFLGRYVKIIKKDGTAFNLAEISIKDFKSEHKILSSNSYPINQSLYAYDNRLNSYASVKGSSLEPPSMLFDLGSDRRITDVDLSSIDSSLIGADVYIIADDGSTKFLKSIDEPLFDNHLNIKPYVLSEDELSKLPKTDVINVYSYPSCITDGCLQNGLPILNQKYIVPDTNTCYIPIKTDPTCFTNQEFDNVFGNAMESCYKSCSSTEDTRFPPSTGRYVIIRNTSQSSIIINSLKATNVDNTEYPILHKFVKNPVNSSRGDDLNSLSISIAAGGYIQIDLGSNKVIGKVNYSGSNLTNNSSLSVYNSMDITKPDAGLVFSTNITNDSGSISTKQSLSGTDKISIGESFNYPSCNNNNSSDCLNKNNYPRPFFKYTFSDNRCVTSKNTICNLPGCMDSVENKSISDANLSNFFDSCDSRYDTRFPALEGRYVRIQSPNDIGFKISELYVLYNNSRNSEPVKKYGLNVINIGNIVDMNNNTYGEVSNKTANDPVPFLEFDYGNDILVSSIEVKHYDNSLVGKILYLINDEGTIIYQKVLTRDQESYIVSPITSDTITPIDSIQYNYPECSLYCLPDGKQIEDQQYIIDDRCLEAITDASEASCLELARNNTLYGSAMDSCFRSCSNTEDTRYPDVTGKYIRLTNGGSGELSIDSINGVDSSGTNIPIYDTFAKGGTAIQYRSDNLLSPNNIAKISGENSYIQTTLNSSTIIKQVKISIPSNANSLIGSTINILNQDGKIVSEYKISDKDVITNGTMTLDIIANKDGSQNLLNIESFNYPSCINNSIAYECVSSSGLSRENIRYTLSDGRCGISKTKCDCMTGFNDNRLTLQEMNTNFFSCDPSKETRFPSVIGRYVRIQGTAGFAINSLVAKDKNGNIITPVRSMAYPLITDSFSRNMLDNIPTNNTQLGGPVNNPDGVSINPFAFVDYETNKTIDTITVNGSNLAGTILYVIDTNGNTVYQYTLTDSNNTIYPISVYNTTYNSVNTVNTFAYTGCAELGCVTNDGADTYHIPNQIYKTTDNRCLKAIGYQSINNCLDNIDNLIGTSMDACFESCSNIDTRYSVVRGRFIRLTPYVPNTKLQVKTLQAYETQQSSPYTIITKHCAPFDTVDSRSELLNDGSSTSYAASTGYIQIDLGEDRTIGFVKVKTTGSFDITIINETFQEVHKSMNYPAATNDTIIQVTANGSNSFIQVIETYLYSTTFNGSLVYLTNKPKVLYIYTFDVLSVISPSIPISIKCINANSPDNILAQVKDNLLSYTDMELYFDSTRNDIDTRFPHAVGTHIKIDGPSSSGFTLNTINITNVTDIPYDTIIWPKVSSTQIDYSTQNCNNNCTKPFVQMYYLNVQNFTKITLSPITSLVGGKISIINANGEIQSQITIITGVSTYELLHFKTLAYSPVDLMNTFKYNTCVNLGCIENSVQNPYHFVSQKYLMDDATDRRCFIAKDRRTVQDCLSRINDLTTPLAGTDMENCFVSCSLDYDSRYNTAVGRFIRLVRTDTNTNIKLVKMTVYKNETDIVVPIMAHAQPVKNSNYGEKMIDNLVDTYAEAEGTGAYLQVDLGSDQNIYSIILTPFDRLSLTGTRLLIINENKELRATYDIVTNTDITNIKITNNVSSNQIIDVSQVFDWECRTFDCVNDVGKTKHLFKYSIPSDSRCLVSKNICSNNNCVSNIINYQEPVQVILDDFGSCNGTYDSQFTTVTGRYIRIRRINGTTSPIKIYTINVYNKNKNLLTTSSTKTFLKPYNNKYSSLMVDGDNNTFIETGTGVSNYVQLDLGSNMEIAKVEIIADYGTLNNTELLVVNNNNFIVYKTIFDSTNTNINSNL